MFLMEQEIIVNLMEYGDHCHYGGVGDHCHFDGVQIPSLITWSTDTIVNHMEYRYHR